MTRPDEEAFAIATACPLGWIYYVLCEVGLDGVVELGI